MVCSTPLKFRYNLISILHFPIQKKMKKQRMVYVITFDIISIVNIKASCEIQAVINEKGSLIDY